MNKIPVTEQAPSTMWEMEGMRGTTIELTCNKHLNGYHVKGNSSRTHKALSPAR